MALSRSAGWPIWKALVWIMLAVSLSAASWATTKTWEDPVSGDWSDGTKWDPPGAPSATDTVGITVAGTYTVTLDVDATVAALSLGTTSDSQTLGLGSHILTLNGDSSIEASGTLDLRNSIVNISGATTLMNAGLVFIHGGASTLNNTGTFLNTSAGTLRIVAENAEGTYLTLDQGMTNEGMIQLTNTEANRSATLNLSDGTLVNAPGAAIDALEGAGGGGRLLQAEVDNQGTIRADLTLEINKNAANHANSGLIEVTGGNLQITLSGGATFANSGSIDASFAEDVLVSGGGIFDQTGSIAMGSGSLLYFQGTLNWDGGTLSGLGTTIQLSSSTAEFLTDFMVGDGVTLDLRTSTVDIAAGTTLTNESLVLVHHGASVLSNVGTFANTSVGTLRIVAEDGLGAQLTVDQGMTTEGRIELTNTQSNRPATMRIANGTLVNGPTAEIVVLEGAGGGTRQILAELDNQGTILAELTLEINKNSANHLNSGLIQVTAGDLNINLGGGASFANSGAIDMMSAEDIQVFGDGTFDHTGSIAMGMGSTLYLTGTLNWDGGVLSGAGATIRPDGVANFLTDFTIADEDTLDLRTSTVNIAVGTTLTNEGHVLVHYGTSALYNVGIFANTSDGVLRIVAENSQGAYLTVNEGMTNEGRIELTNTQLNRNAGLTLANGTLTNGPKAQIDVLAGAGGGTRQLLVELDNQGTIQADLTLEIYRSSANHINSGLIHMTGGDLDVTVVGVTSLTNSGTIDVAPEEDIHISGGGSFHQMGSITMVSGGLLYSDGILNWDGGTLTGSGATIQPDGIANFLTDFVLGDGNVLDLRTSTLNIAAGTTLTNEGLVLVHYGTSTLNNTGTFANDSLGTLRIVAEDALHAQLTVDQGMTNEGLIELTNTESNQNAALSLTNGTLVNAPMATIDVLEGAGGGTRQLVAELDNQGRIHADLTLEINKNSANHLNSGVIELAAGDLEIRLGGGASFANNGTIDASLAEDVLVSSDGVFGNAGSIAMGPGGLLYFAGTLNWDGGALIGSGVTIQLSNATANVLTDLPVVKGNTLDLRSATINVAAGAILANESLCLVHYGASGLNNAGTFSNTSGGTLRIVAENSQGAQLTVDQGIANDGRIELTNTLPDWPATLTVANGTLINAPEAEIDVLEGAGGGSRQILAELDNQGTISAALTLEIYKSSADHLNSGLIQMTGGNLQINLGGGASFANSGTIDAGSAEGVLVSSNGTFDHTGSLVMGSGGLLYLDGTLNWDGGTLSGSGVTIELSSATANLFSDFTVANGDTLDLRNSTVNIPDGETTLTNDGLVMIRYGESDVDNAGVFSNTSAGTLRIVAENSQGAHLTMDQGITNWGRIELTNTQPNEDATLTVTNGTLVNAPGATVDVLEGAGGATRKLLAELDNEGTINIAASCHLDKGSANHFNSGTIRVTGGDLTIQQSGATPTFTTSGTVLLRESTTLLVAGTDPDYVQTGGMTRLISGTLTAGRIVDIQGGLLDGDGTVNGDVRNAGELSPGAGMLAAGVITMNGAYEQLQSGTLRAEYGGVDPGDFDWLSVSGDAALAGSLKVAAIDDYTLVLGDTIDVLTCGSRIDTFLVIINENECPELANCVDVTYDSAGVSLVGLEHSASVEEGLDEDENGESQEEADRGPDPDSRDDSDSPDEPESPPEPAPFIPTELRFYTTRSAHDQDLRLDLPEPASVDVSIFEVTGRRLATLHLGDEEAGCHAYRWNDISAHGQRLASGIYFVRAQIVTEQGRSVRTIRIVNVR